MELSERFIRELEQTYPIVYECQDKPGAVHQACTHPFPTAFYVTDGELAITLAGAVQQVPQNGHFTIPAQTEYVITAGPKGAIYVVGEGA